MYMYGITLHGVKYDLFPLAQLLVVLVPINVQTDRIIRHLPVHWVVDAHYVEKLAPDELRQHTVGDGDARAHLSDQQGSISTARTDATSCAHCARC